MVCRKEDLALLTLSERIRMAIFGESEKETEWVLLMDAIER